MTYLLSDKSGRFDHEGYPDKGYHPVHVDTKDLLASFFDIDRDKAEKERQKLLEYVRQQS